jgi:Uma2 family endonuclease
MSTATGLISADELLRMGPGRRELVRGEVREMPPAGGEHGVRAAHIVYLLKDFAIRNGVSGKVFGAETGFIVGSSPDTVRGADAAYMSDERLPGGNVPKEFVRGAPDLAVEVMSPGDTLGEVEEKVDQYLSAGSRLVWVVNPLRSTVTIYRPSARPKMLVMEDVIDGGEVLPGFRVKVAEVFR